MRPSRLWIIVGAIACLALIRTSWHGVHAREDRREPPKLSVLLEEPGSFPFGKATPLPIVADHLRRDLNAQVLLDLAALKRLKLDETATVRLDLKNITRSTGLRLLLSQVNMTFRVEDDDGLLILTDRQGAADPLAQIEDRLDELHREVHDLQDAVEEVYQTVAPQEQGPALRSPTIIEELPEDDPDGAIAVPPGRPS
jgi:hypothetical protein